MPLISNVPDSKRVNDAGIVRKAPTGNSILGISLEVHDHDLLVHAVEFMHRLDSSLGGGWFFNGVCNDKRVQVLVEEKEKGLSQWNFKFRDVNINLMLKLICQGCFL